VKSLASGVKRLHRRPFPSRKQLQVLPSNQRPTIVQVLQSTTALRQPVLTAMFPYPAVLLLGPTGSGKTPLGEYLESRGLWNTPCVHFDFGANLRDAVAGNQPDGALMPEDLAVLRQVLETGALLEGKQIGIAQRLIRAFLESRKVERDTWLVLNGLPRHLGQARALETVLNVQVVVNLDCSEQTAFARIRRNSGGDRAGRADDDPAAVAKRLDTFRHRTAPLLAYYGARTARVLQVPVAADTTPQPVWETIERCGPSVPRFSRRRGGHLPYRPEDDTLGSVLSS